MRCEGCDELINTIDRIGFWRQLGKEANVSFHSDRGSQYCSGDFQDLLTSYGMRSSMSRKGNCWDVCADSKLSHELRSMVFRNERRHPFNLS